MVYNISNVKKIIENRIDDLYKIAKSVISDVDGRNLKLESNNIDKLKELTVKLNGFTIQKNNKVIYDLEGGEAKGYGLYSNAIVAIQRCFCPKNTKFLNHTHNEIKYLIFYDGGGKIIINGKTKEFCVGSFFVIEAKVEHSIIFDEDTWVIGITIPKAKGYPE